MEKVHSIFKNLGPDVTHFHSHSFGETSHVTLPGWKRGLVNASLPPMALYCAGEHRPQ